MKKINFLSLITCIIFPIYTNQIQESVQKLYDEIRPEYEAMLKEQHRIINIINSVCYGKNNEYNAFIEEYEVLVEDPKIKEFLRIFYTLDWQASGIYFCKGCLEIEGLRGSIDSNDLFECYEAWRKRNNKTYKETLRTVHHLDKIICKKEMNGNNHELTSAFYQGEHKFNEWFQATIKENSKN